MTKKPKPSMTWTLQHPETGEFLKSHVFGWKWTPDKSEALHMSRSEMSVVQNTYLHLEGDLLKVVGS